MFAFPGICLRGICGVRRTALRVMRRMARTLYIISLLSPVFLQRLGAKPERLVKLESSYDEYVQSLEQKPAASPLAQWNSSGLLSTKHIDSGFVFPLSLRKYAALSPIIPAPRITVCGSFGPGVGLVVLDVDVAVVGPFGIGALSEVILK